MRGRFGWGALLALGAAALAAPIAAQSATDEPVADRPGPVIASLEADWNGDGRKDRAELRASEEAADLYLYLSGYGDGAKPTVVARNLVWHAEGLEGQQAGLELSEAGSIVVTSQNTAIGRDRWSERLTLAYRRGAMRVAGYSRLANDTLDLSYRQNCDINLLTGRGLLNGAPIHMKRGAPAVQDWSAENTPPEACEAAN